MKRIKKKTTEYEEKLWANRADKCVFFGRSTIYIVNCCCCGACVIFIFPARNVLCLSSVTYIRNTIFFIAFKTISRKAEQQKNKVKNYNKSTKTHTKIMKKKKKCVFFITLVRLTIHVRIYLLVSRCHCRFTALLH